MVPDESAMDLLPGRSPAGARLAQRFWPGPLTIILTAKTSFPIVLAGGETVGLRCPDHPLTLALLRGWRGCLRGAFRQSLRRAQPQDRRTGAGIL